MLKIQVSVSGSFGSGKGEAITMLKTFLGKNGWITSPTVLYEPETISFTATQSPSQEEINTAVKMIQDIGLEKAKELVQEEINRRST